MKVEFSNKEPLREEILVPYQQKDYCYTLRDLRPDTNYTIWLHAENKYGVGNTTIFKFRTVDGKALTFYVNKFYRANCC